MFLSSMTVDGSPLVYGVAPCWTLQVVYTTPLALCRRLPGCLMHPSRRTPSARSPPGPASLNSKPCKRRYVGGSFRPVGDRPRPKSCIVSNVAGQRLWAKGDGRTIQSGRVIQYESTPTALDGGLLHCCRRYLHNGSTEARNVCRQKFINGSSRKVCRFVHRN